MAEPMLLVVQGSKYQEAKFEFNTNETEKSLVPKENGQTFEFKALLPIGIQEKLKATGVPASSESVKKSLDSLIGEAKERVRDMGAPFFVAGIDINEYSDMPEDHMQIVIGHSYSVYNDIELRLQAYIKRE